MDTSLDNQETDMDDTESAKVDYHRTFVPNLIIEDAYLAVVAYQSKALACSRALEASTSSKDSVAVKKAFLMWIKKLIMVFAELLDNSKHLVEEVAKHTWASLAEEPFTAWIAFVTSTSSNATITCSYLEQKWARSVVNFPSISV